MDHESLPIFDISSGAIGKGSGTYLLPIVPIDLDCFLKEVILVLCPRVMVNLRV
jgi:hypothetical protein